MSPPNLEPLNRTVNPEPNLAPLNPHLEPTRRSLRRAVYDIRMRTGVLDPAATCPPAVTSLSAAARR